MNIPIFRAKILLDKLFSNTAAGSLQEINGELYAIGFASDLDGGFGSTGK